MRDPDLVSRAQRAAAALERAWDHWRTSDGLDAQPPPPVSSYVGYSLEEPWGQPRVVFGVAAEEAEQLAALLDRHECASQPGPDRPAAAGQQLAGGPAARTQRVPAARAGYSAPGSLPNGTAGYSGPGSPANGTARQGAPQSLPNGTAGYSGPGSPANGTARQGAPQSLPNGTADHDALGRRATGIQADLAGLRQRQVPIAQTPPPLHRGAPVPRVPATPPVQAEDRRLGWAAIYGYASPPARAETGSASQAVPVKADQYGQADQYGHCLLYTSPSPRDCS